MLESNSIFLSPHKKSVDFSKLTQGTLEACYGYYPDPGFFEILKREENAFRDLV